MKRLALAIGILAAAIIGCLAIDKLVLKPQRQAIKTLRYYAQADTRRIHELEQLVAQSSSILRSNAPRKAAERCIRSTVSSVHADYDSVPAQFHRCKAEIASYISAWQQNPPEDFLFTVYVTALASQLGVYGPSDETDVRVIAKGGVLSCAQAMIFVAATLKIFKPSLSVTEIVLETASTGQHTLVEASIGGRKIVTDGSTGTIYLASFEHITNLDSKHIAIIDLFDETDIRLSMLFQEMVRLVQMGRLSSKDLTGHRFL